MWAALAGGNPDEGKRGKIFALCLLAFTFAGKFIKVGAATANIKTQLPVPMETEDQLLFRNLLNLQHQTETAKASSLVDQSVTSSWPY